MRTNKTNKKVIGMKVIICISASLIIAKKDGLESIIKPKNTQISARGMTAKVDNSVAINNLRFTSKTYLVS